MRIRLLGLASCQLESTCQQEQADNCLKACTLAVAQGIQGSVEATLCHTRAPHQPDQGPEPRVSVRPDRVYILLQASLDLHVPGAFAESSMLTGLGYWSICRRCQDVDYWDGEPRPARSCLSTPPRKLGSGFLWQAVRYHALMNGVQEAGATVRVRRHKSSTYGRSTYDTNTPALGPGRLKDPIVRVDRRHFTSAGDIVILTSYEPSL